MSLSLSVSLVGHTNNQELYHCPMETACIISVHYFQWTTPRFLLLSLLSLEFGPSDNAISTNDNISFSSSFAVLHLFNQQLMSGLFSLGHVCRHKYICVWTHLAENKRLWKYFGFNFIVIKRDLYLLSVFFSDKMIWCTGVVWLATWHVSH